MAKWMAEIDQRTRLAGANKMELLMFHLGSNEIYGINVFKIREVMQMPLVTKIPDSDPRVLGLMVESSDSLINPLPNALFEILSICKPRPSSSIRMTMLFPS